MCHILLHVLTIIFYICSFDHVFTVVHITTILFYSIYYFPAIFCVILLSTLFSNHNIILIFYIYTLFIHIFFYVLILLCIIGYVFTISHFTTIILDIIYNYTRCYIVLIIFHILPMFNSNTIFIIHI